MKLTKGKISKILNKKRALWLVLLFTKSLVLMKNQKIF